MVSPLRRQYLGIKQQYPDVILFFHLGDFYETFDEDAITLNRVLEVKATFARTQAPRAEFCPVRVGSASGCEVRVTFGR